MDWFHMNGVFVFYLFFLQYPVQLLVENEMTRDNQSYVGIPPSETSTPSYLKYKYFYWTFVYEWSLFWSGIFVLSYLYLGYFVLPGIINDLDKIEIFQSTAADCMDRVRWIYKHLEYSIYHHEATTSIPKVVNIKEKQKVIPKKRKARGRGERLVRRRQRELEEEELVRHHQAKVRAAREQAAKPNKTTIFEELVQFIPFDVEITKEDLQQYEELIKRYQRKHKATQFRSH